MEKDVQFVPQLIIDHGTMELDFYKQVLGAVEWRKFCNDDGSIHVSEMKIGNTLFHFHEATMDGYCKSPLQYGGVTTIIGLMVEDVDAVMERAAQAGAVIMSPAQSYDYGYRQGEFKDPFGHKWLIEKVI